MERTYRIGEIAQRTGLSVEAVRYYERVGLLPHPPRTEGGVRRYDPKVVDRIRFIKQAQTLGLSLRQIRQLNGDTHRLGRAACRRVHDLLAEHIATVDARLRDLRHLRRTLSGFLKQCEAALDRDAEPECPTLNTPGDRRS